ncbi:hypothetical protein KEM54_005378 [Ascosphaera aggregata]|nr:hypothetical protein KEM54_005378 [Ascosphaera aggregata]
MLVAHVLADLSTLGLCGPDEALALVSQSAGTIEQPSEDEKSSLRDLQQAKDLIRLHAEMKAKLTRHVSMDSGPGAAVVSVDADLVNLRMKVRRVREQL